MNNDKGTDKTSVLLWDGHDFRKTVFVFGHKEEIELLLYRSDNIRFMEMPPESTYQSFESFTSRHPHPGGLW